MNLNFRNFKITYPNFLDFRQLYYIPFEARLFLAYL